MAGTWAVEVEYVMHAGSEHNTFGTFRSEKAAKRFVAQIRAWDDARVVGVKDDVRTVFTRVYPITKPALDFVVEDVERNNERVTVSSYPHSGAAGR